MRGLLINEKERQELQYILKRELEEILLDYEDGRIDGTVKKTMEEKYQLVLSLYRRISSQTEFKKYALSFHQMREKSNMKKKM